MQERQERQETRKAGEPSTTASLGPSDHIGLGKGRMPKRGSDVHILIAIVEVRKTNVRADAGKKNKWQNKIAYRKDGRVGEGKE
jgi:hypothetical protein